jgi:hypothetical protein
MAAPPAGPGNKRGDSPRADTAQIGHHVVGRLPDPAQRIGLVQKLLEQ